MDMFVTCTTMYVFFKSQKSEKVTKIDDNFYENNPQNWQKKKKKTIIKLPIPVFFNQQNTSRMFIRNAYKCDLFP